MDAMIEVRTMDPGMDRLSLLAPKDIDQGNQKGSSSNTTFMVTTYNPVMKAHKSIIVHKLPYLGLHVKESARIRFAKNAKIMHVQENARILCKKSILHCKKYIWK